MQVKDHLSVKRILDEVIQESKEEQITLLNSEPDLDEENDAQSSISGVGLPDLLSANYKVPSNVSTDKVSDMNSERRRDVDLFEITDSEFLEADMEGAHPYTIQVLSILKNSELTQQRKTKLLSQTFEWLQDSLTQSSGFSWPQGLGFLAYITLIEEAIEDRNKSSLPTLKLLHSKIKDCTIILEECYEIGYRSIDEWLYFDENIMRVDIILRITELWNNIVQKYKQESEVFDKVMKKAQPRKSQGKPIQRNSLSTPISVKEHIRKDIHSTSPYDDEMLSPRKIEKSNTARSASQHSGRSRSPSKSPRKSEKARADSELLQIKENRSSLDYHRASPRNLHSVDKAHTHRLNNSAIIKEESRKFLMGADGIYTGFISQIDEKKGIIAIELSPKCTLFADLRTEYYLRNSIEVGDIVDCAVDWQFMKAKDVQTIGSLKNIPVNDSNVHQMPSYRKLFKIWRSDNERRDDMDSKDKYVQHTKENFRNNLLELNEYQNTDTPRTLPISELTIDEGKVKNTSIRDLDDIVSDYTNSPLIIQQGNVQKTNLEETSPMKSTSDQLIESEENEEKENNSFLANSSDSSTSKNQADTHVEDKLKSHSPQSDEVNFEDTPVIESKEKDELPIENGYISFDLDTAAIPDGDISGDDSTSSLMSNDDNVQNNVSELEKLDNQSNAQKSSWENNMQSNSDEPGYEYSSSKLQNSTHNVFQRDTLNPEPEKNHILLESLSTISNNSIHINEDHLLSPLSSKVNEIRNLLSDIEQNYSSKEVVFPSISKIEEILSSIKEMYDLKIKQVLLESQQRNDSPPLKPRPSSYSSPKLELRPPVKSSMSVSSIKASKGDDPARRNSTSMLKCSPLPKISPTSAKSKTSPSHSITTKDTKGHSSTHRLNQSPSLRKSQTESKQKASQRDERSKSHRNVTKESVKPNYDEKDKRTSPTKRSRKLKIVQERMKLTSNGNAQGIQSRRKQAFEVIDKDQIIAHLEKHVIQLKSVIEEQAEAIIGLRGEIHVKSKKRRSMV